jgi:ribosome-associated translation inhibitor RaiA
LKPRLDRLLSCVALLRAHESHRELGITADLIDGPRLFVDATEAWPFAAITNAASRLGEAIRRVNKRQSAHRGGAPTTHRIQIH